ncbi:MAG: tRNA (adenosine(37)-N6)-dimethylallyltransferase MiaA [Phycisphaerae bacterium]|nr:tRNA (adenosine(37)-N6)-dimethylallyltransferase MiaA [Phycisphaerae bacterium]
MAIRVDFILGCTGCGKGRVGRALARRLDAEIVSVDSMKVYRRMDIGTAKPSAEERAEVPHHLMDIVEPSESFSAARFVEAADAAIAEIAGRGRRILAVGGTCLYIKSLTEGLFEGPGADPAIRATLRERAAAEGSAALHAELQRIDPVAAERIHPNDLRRIERAIEVFQLTGTPISELQKQWDQSRTRYDCRFWGLRREKLEQSQRINLRVHRMIEIGLVDEVRALLAEPAGLSEVAAQAVGYAEISAHLRGACPIDDAIEDIKINSRHLAKSQRTWFRRWQGVHWTDIDEADTVDSVVERLLPQIVAA